MILQTGTGRGMTESPFTGTARQGTATAICNLGWTNVQSIGLGWLPLLWALESEMLSESSCLESFGCDKWLLKQYMKEVLYNNT
jgi:hypothetical protein